MSHSLSCELEDGDPSSRGRGFVPLEYSGSAPHLAGAPACGDPLQGRRHLLRPLCLTLVVLWALRDTSLQLREGMQASPGGAEFRGVGVSPSLMFDSPQHSLTAGQD